MKKVIGVFALVIVLSTMAANAGCFYNMTSGYCCENGEMYCAPEAGVDCNGKPEMQ